MKRVVLAGVIVVCLVAAFLVAWGTLSSGSSPESDMPGERGTFGGGCSYHTYDGQCTVSSVHDNGMVMFTFGTQETIDASRIVWADDAQDVTGRTFAYKTTEIGIGCSKTSPSRDEMRECGLTNGTVYACKAKLLEKGSCVPMEFSFRKKVS